MLYAYSNGAFSTHTNDGGIDPYSQAYNVVAGIGTAQFSLFQGSAYVGYQGSNSDGSGQAGGAKYGVKIFLSCLLDDVRRNDETINKASATGVSKPGTGRQLTGANRAEQFDPYHSSVSANSISDQHRNGPRLETSAIPTSGLWQSTARSGLGRRQLS